MIIAKRRAFLACFLLLCLLLCSCNRDLTGLSPLHSLGNVNDEEERPPIFEYDYIILPASAGETLTARAHALCEALSARTGIPATLFFDDEPLPEWENARLILLGNTAHALSYKHLHALRRDDYLCTTDKNALLLGGKSDTATIAAIDRFCAELLPYADATVLVNADQHFRVYATYDVEAISVNGFSLADYRLVYPKKNQNGEHAIALALREAIADRCGFYLDVLPDAFVSEPSRIIAIGACFGEDDVSEPQFLATDSTIMLFGSSEHAMATVAQAFYRHLFPDGTHTSLSVSITEPMPIPLGAPSLSAFVGLLHDFGATADVTEIAQLCTDLRNTGALLAPFSEMSSSSFSYLQSNLSDYACVLLSPDPHQILPFFYREDALLLLEQTAANGIHVLRFAIRETAETFTVCHGYANTQAAVDSLLQASLPSISDHEPCLLFAATPITVSLTADESLPFALVGTTEESGERMHVLLYLPTALASTVALPPTGEDTPYCITFTHPFLRK